MRKYRKTPKVEVNIGNSKDGKQFSGVTEALAFAVGLLKLPQIEDIKITKLKDTDPKAADQTATS
jgi:hypothetical protein